jgi:hypothetical protein
MVHEGDVRQWVKNTVICDRETVWTGRGERPLRNKKDKEETVFNLDKTKDTVDSYPVRHHDKDCKDKGNGDENTCRNTSLSIVGCCFIT